MDLVKPLLMFLLELSLFFFIHFMGKSDQLINIWLNFSLSVLFLLLVDFFLVSL
jgi:hypothetical protein